MRTPCTECGEPSVGRGYCKNHYRAFMKYGDPNGRANLRGVPFERRYTIDDKGCWFWIGSTDTCGYGIWKAHGQRSAHRASYVLHKGEIPPGMHVLHKCDQPNCVNPDHLRLGTHQENMADLRAKGRAYGASGATNLSAKLTEAQAIAILTDTRRTSVIAKEYELTQASVMNIKKGKTWKHLQ